MHLLTLYLRMNTFLILFACITISVQDICMPSIQWNKKRMHFLNTDILDSNTQQFPKLHSCVDYCGSVSHNEIVYYNKMSMKCTCMRIQVKHFYYSQQLIPNPSNEKQVVMHILNESK